MTNTTQQHDAGLTASAATGHQTATGSTLVTLDTEHTIHLGAVALESPGTSTLTVYGKIVTTEAPGRPRVAWADVRVEDSELSTGGAFLPDARQAGRSRTTSSVSVSYTHLTLPTILLV